MPFRSSGTLHKAVHAERCIRVRRELGGLADKLVQFSKGCTQLSGSHWIKPSYVRVSATPVHQSCLCTTEILTDYQSLISVPHWIEYRSVVISATSTYQNRCFTSEKCSVDLMTESVQSMRLLTMIFDCYWLPVPHIVF
jgi:hypothetical protein